MATTSEARALPFFTDLQGLPLSSGFIYIGQAGLDPVAYPAVVTSDIAGTVVVAQPIRTTNGNAAAAGSLIHMFVPIPYSITILDSARRLVYTSLQETDPVAIAVGASGVQSASSLAELRARSKNLTNQVWVSAFGMYVYDPTDNTSPEDIPYVIVGSDGGRYRLSLQYVNSNFVRVAGAADPNQPGTYISWGDDVNGTAFLTNNQGSGTGGFVTRTLKSDGATELGRITQTSAGGLVATSDIRTSGQFVAEGGAIDLNAAGDRYLQYDGTNYNLASANLNVNGSQALTVASLPAQLVNIFQNHLVGAILLNTSSSVSPTPGTWFLMVGGLGSTGIAEWLRIA